MKGLDWGENTLKFGDLEFIYESYTTERSNTDRLVLFKDRGLLEAIINVFDELQPKRVFELGIWQGGSTGLFSAYSLAEKYAAIDYSQERIEALDKFLERNNLLSKVFPFYGIDQGNSEQLRSIYSEIFKGEPLDLVLDDASHQLVETRKSFETLFPLLRPGGMYVIEDWQWGLKPVTQRERVENKLALKKFPKGQTLALMPMELVMAAAKNDVIRSLTVSEYYVKIERGEANLDEHFKITDLYPPEGQELLGRHDIIDNPRKPPPLPIRLYRKFYRRITGQH